ncbi:MAG: thioesterase family protein [Sandaracinaceae bacterium]
MTFRDVCKVSVGEEGLRCDVPEGWEQGRGAFGGLGIGLALRALEREEPERPLRALTAELPGPLLAGPATIETRALRRGTGLSSLEATLSQEGEVKVRVTGLFGVARAEDVAFSPPAPEVTPWRDVPPLSGEALPPRFARHFQYRVTGPPPFSAGDEARASGWIQFTEPLDAWGGAELAALADAWWPSFFARLDGFRPMGTVTFTLQLTEAARDLDPTQPLYYRARSDVASAGYVSEHRELWTPDGRLVALNPQTFVVIR